MTVANVDNAMRKWKVLTMLYTGVDMYSVYSVYDKEEGEKVRDPKYVM